MKTKLLESDYANKTFADKNTLGIQQYAPTTTNALQIDLGNGLWNGKVEAIRTSDASLIQNYFIKSGVTVALKSWFAIVAGKECSVSESKNEESERRHRGYRNP